MQLSLSWRFGGQRKPFASIPRINWAHPLVQGLAVYCYDAGGTYIDLINGGQSTLVSTSGRSNSKFGTGVLWPQLTSYGSLPSNNNATLVGQTAPFSVATATFYPSSLGGTNGTIVCTGEVSNTGNTATGFSTGVNANIIQALYNNGANSVNFTANIATATYQSWGYTGATSTTGSLYASGKLDQNVTGIVSTLSVGTSHVIFNSAKDNGQAFGGGLNGFLPYYAVWQNRVLAAEDYRLLHDDPFCFLIYPEDEMFAALVGAVADTFANTGRVFFI